MTTQYNVALKVNYNGQQVSAGAPRNAKELNQLQMATAQQGKASAVSATQNTSLASSYRLLAGAVSIYAAQRTALGFVSDAAASELLTTRIRNLTGSYERNDEVQKYLFETADKLNVRYGVLANSYSRLIVLENQRTVTATESRDILEGMTNVAKTLGATNAQVEQSMYGMTQAMTQGRVQAQELNQVVEPLPGLLQAMDKAAGTVSGGFRKMVVNGEVSSQMFKTVLITALQDYQGAAAASADTIAAAQAKFGTSYDAILKKLEQPVNDAITPIINAATDAVNLLGDNVDVLSDVADGAVLLSAVLAGKLVGSISASAAASVKDTLAKQANLVAQQNAAAASITAATTQVHYTTQLQAGAQRQLAAAKTDLARTTALKNLAIQNGQAIAAQNALTAATTRYTAAATRAAIGGRILSGAMGILGGPVGLITTAAIAVAYFGTAANDAVDPTDDLTESTRKLAEEQEKLNPFSNYTKARAERALALYQGQLDNAQALLDEARIRAVNNPDSEVALFEFKSSSEQVEDLTQRIQFLDQVVAKFEAASELKTSKDYTDDLARLIAANQTAEEQIKSTYANRQEILDGAKQQGLLTKQKYDELTLRLELQKDTDLDALTRKALQEQERLQVQAHEAEVIRLKRQNEEKIALIQGFKDRESMLQYNSEVAVSREINDQKIREAKGFSTRQKEEEHAQAEALLDATARRTGAVRGLLFSQAEWERKNELEKTDAVLEIGEFGFKQMAGQSKKAFAMYKAFAITKAVINTYEMATGAYNSLATIPIVGPALGAAAAVAAVAYGLNQVNQIRSQQYSAAYHGGKDYIPEEQTALLQKGERVVSPKQNVALTAAADKINKGDVAAGTTIYYSPTITVEGGDDASFAKASQLEQQMYERFEARVINQLQTGSGRFYSAVRNVA